MDSSVNTVTKTEKFESEDEVENYSRQYLVTLTASLAFGIVGIHFGWFGPTYLLLSEETSEIVVTSAQSAWLSGFLQIGAIPGPFIGSYITSKYGRQKGIYFTVVPNALSFILFFFSTDINMLYAARFFSGIAVGATFVVVPVYISEISSAKIRGALGIITNVFMATFNLLEFCIIPYLTIKANIVICLVILSLQVFSLPFIPETPYYYISKNMAKKAENSLKVLRQKTNVQKELLELQQGWDEQNGGKNLGVFQCIKETIFCRAFLILFGVIFCQQFSGGPPVIGYSQIIFKSAHASITPETSGIILNSAGLLMAICSTFVIDSWGRKILFILSCLFSTIALLTLGFYFHLLENSVEGVLDYSLVPLAALILFIFALGLGLGPLPYIFVGELFPTHTRAMAGSIISIIGSVFGLSVTILYQRISEIYGASYAFVAFAAINACSLLFGVYFVPETKGKSLNEIQKDLELQQKKNPQQSPL